MSEWLGRLFGFVLNGIIILLCLFFVLAVGVMVYDSLNKVPYEVRGVVVDKHYTPASSSSGIGIAPQSGQTSVVMTHTSEKFTLVLDQSGNIAIWEVARDMYMLSEVGKEAVLHCYQGPLTGTVSCE